MMRLISHSTRASKNLILLGDGVEDNEVDRNSSDGKMTAIQLSQIIH